MPSLNLREAIANGARAAGRLHMLHGFIDKTSGDEAIDVFDFIHSEKLPLCFRKLDKLYGAYLPSSGGKGGVLINSEHPSYTQRFTAAHELGHFILKHKASLDMQMLLRAPVYEYDKDSGNSQLQEREADSFASAFLLPKWLIIKHLRKLQWTVQDLLSPNNLYQLSLRLGVSYPALCWGLFTNNLFSYEQAKNFTDLQPKKFKQELIEQAVLKENPRGNVWNLNIHSSDTTILGGIQDFFVIALREQASGGYLWDFSELENNGFKIVENQIQHNGKDIFGGSIERRLVFLSEQPFSGDLKLKETRPWNNEIGSELSWRFRLYERRRGFYTKISLIGDSV